VRERAEPAEALAARPRDLEEAQRHLRLALDTVRRVGSTGWSADPENKSAFERPLAPESQIQYGPR
jgi:hypothetical protein